MPGTNFSVDAVVRIIVRGELSRKQSATSGSGLRKRCDDPLLHRLNEFLHQQEIIPAAVNSRNGCGIHVGYYEAADAARIQAWLVEQGITQL